MKTILTLNGYFNYGNRLQLFALSRILGEYDDQIFVYWPKERKAVIREFIKYNTVFHNKFEKEIKIRKFTKKNVPPIIRHDLRGCLVVGSDQVWNPENFKKDVYLLTASNDDIKISYAASMGVEKLTNSQRELFAKGLERYDAISVREESARKLLQPLTNKRISVVLDPTLLLDKSEYERLEIRPKDVKIGEKYILCYVLGGREQQRAIEEFAKNNNCRIILFSDKDKSSYGIEEFLYLIHHAEMICTDSFHACVFSFIFERPFVVFRRSGTADYMYSRLQNFIDVFHLENREFNGKNITTKNMKVDYTEAKKILNKERASCLHGL